jgi:hypothetical protein
MCSVTVVRSADQAPLWHADARSDPRGSTGICSSAEWSNTSRRRPCGDLGARREAKLRQDAAELLPTVRSLTSNLSAMARLDRPPPISPATSRSRAVSPPNACLAKRRSDASPPEGMCLKARSRYASCKVSSGISAASSCTPARAACISATASSRRLPARRQRASPACARQSSDRRSKARLVSMASANTRSASAAERSAVSASPRRIHTRGATFPGASVAASLSAIPRASPALPRASKSSARAHQSCRWVADSNGISTSISPSRTAPAFAKSRFRVCAMARRAAAYDAHTDEPS